MDNGVDVGAGVGVGVGVGVDVDVGVGVDVVLAGTKPTTGVLGLCDAGSPGTDP